MPLERRRRMLRLIVVAQFLGTSLWFVGNAVTSDLEALWPQVEGVTGWLTSMVQLGFIAGTATFAVLALSDRIPAPRLFAIAAGTGALVNAATPLVPPNFGAFLALRFATGFCLAGVYPVGMKLAASWYREGLGHAIGLLVGALVLGTAFPHLLRSVSLPWVPVVLSASGMALAGAVLILLFVAEGPHCAHAANLDLREVPRLFRRRTYRRASLGYFGHMWELYALWAFAPLALAHALPDLADQSNSVLAFSFIAAGAVGCVAGGLWSRRVGGARVSFFFLAGSGLCCLASPWVLGYAPPPVLLAFMLAWGIAVAGDSPQFSAIAAQGVPPHLVGTALTLMTAIGFGLTIVSVQLLSMLSALDQLSPRWWFLALAPGPLIGVFAMAGLCGPRPVDRRRSQAGKAVSPGRTSVDPA